MGACISSGGMSEEDKVKHREAEKALKEAKVRMEHQVKVSVMKVSISRVPLNFCTQVLLLGSGDSGKSTILKVCTIICV